MSNLDNENKPSKKSFVDRFKEKRALKAAHKAEVREQHERIISSMSEAEYAEMQDEKMRYFDNKLSHGLGYAGILSSLIAMFIALNTIDPKYYLGGAGVVIAILMNIWILLTGFLTVEKVKTYSKGYSFYMFGLGLFAIVRMFWYPFSTIRLYNQMMGQLRDTAAWDTATYGPKYDYIIEQFKYKLGKSIINGTPVDAKGNKIDKSQLADSTTQLDHIATAGFLTANGNIRGIIMIFFLGVAAACFIVGGVTGYMKSVRLRKYLESHKN
jgi:hypothetical protein